MDKKRIAWMDIAKALGILVVLLVHGELDLGPVTFFGGMFYMPVFFVLAGMTFSYKPRETFGKFLGKKAKRLLLPYLGYNLFLFCFFFVKDSVLTGQVNGGSFFPLLGILYSRNCLLRTGGSNVYFMQILNAPTWFLTGLFVSLAVYWILTKAARGDLRKVFMMNGGVLLAALLLHYLCPVLLPWSFDCALYAVSFLLFGTIAAKLSLVERVYERPWLFLLTAAVFTGLSWLNGSVNMSVAEYGRSMILYLIVGCTGSLLCMVTSLFIERHLKLFARCCEWVGRHTLPILCLHLFVYSVIGTVLGALGM